MLTRNGSLTALNAVPNSMKSYDDVLNALAVINPWLTNLELPTVEIAPARTTDYSGSKLAGTMTDVMPKIANAIASNVQQSKALKKILGVFSASVSYLLSADYEGEVCDRIVNSDTFSRLLDEKLEEKLAGRTGDGSSGRQVVAKPRKERQTDLELHLHYIVHRSINKAFDTGALTVVSDLKIWPDGTDEGFFDESVGGRMVRRWRPMWELIPANGPYENDVVSKVLQEWPGTYTDQQVRSAFRGYKTNILREKKKQDEGRQNDVRAVMRIQKRGGDLLDAMRRKFDASVLNRCSERAFYRAMIESEAFRLERYSETEPHGLPVVTSAMPDGTMAGFDGFALFADVWEKKRVTEKMWAAIDQPWWSDKVRLGFFILLETAKPSNNSRSRTPLFHLPQFARPVISPSTLPLLAPPSTSATGEPLPKRAKTGSSLSLGMINSAIVDDEAFTTWCSLLLQDPDSDGSLPSLEEVLQSSPENQELSRRARQHLVVDRSLTVEHARSIWRIRSQGSEDQYDEVLRARDRAAFLDSFDWDNLGDLYTA